MSLARALRLCPVAAALACQSDPKPKPGVDDSGDTVASASPELELFREGPVRLRNISVKHGRPGAANDLDVRAAAEVVAAQRGSVELPMRMACAFGSHRVVTVSELIWTGGDRFSLKKQRSFEAYAHSPTHMGWLGDTRECELEIRVDPSGTAKKDQVAPASERVCWSWNAVRPGPCAWKDPAPPGEQLALHHMEVGIDHAQGGFEVHTHLQVREAGVYRGSLQIRAACGSGTPAVGDDSVMLRPFGLLAGESVALRVSIPRSGNPPCTLRPSFAPWDQEKQAPGMPIALGAWCVTGDPDARPAEPAKGACP